MSDTTFALWSLVNRPDCKVVDGKVVDAGVVIHDDASILEMNCYIDPRGVVTEVGRRLVEGQVSQITRDKVLAIMGDHDFVLDGMWATCGNRKITRYAALRLAHEGYLELTPRGVVRARLWRVLALMTEAEYRVFQMLPCKTISARLKA